MSCNLVELIGFMLRMMPNYIMTVSYTHLYSDRGASLRSCSVWLVVREPGNLPFSGCWQADVYKRQDIVHGTLA